MGRPPPSLPPKKTKKENTSFASPAELINEWTNEQLAAVAPIIASRLQKFDSEQYDFLRRALVTRCIDYLNDPDKCTPGLLQVVCRILDGSYVQLQDVLPGSRVDEITKNLPTFDEDDL